MTEVEKNQLCMRRKIRSATCLVSNNMLSNKLVAGWVIDDLRCLVQSRGMLCQLCHAKCFEFFDNRLQDTGLSHYLIITVMICIHYFQYFTLICDVC